ELYPAALRAYSNPADPVALAVLNAFPEPGMLPRPDGPDATNRLVAELVADGVADQDTISEAVTALVVAASETPRRGPMPKPVASATVAMVRQAIAAVRAYDAGSAAVVSTITRGADEVPATGRRWTRRTGDTSAVSAKAGPARHAADSTESPTRSASVADSRRASAVDSPSGQPADDRSNYAPASPGRTPSIPTQRTVSPADAGEPFRPTLTTAAINSMRSERQRAKTPRPKAEQTAPSGEFGPADYSVPIPTPRPDKPQSSPPGSRANWPLVNSSDDDRAKPVEDRPSDGQSDRVRPPWLDDDLPPEPPMLRLVEPSLPEAPPEQPERSEAKSLRLVESDAAADWSAQTTEKRGEETDHRLPPVSDDGDDDLLIFAATRSAWFTGRPQESNLEWRSSADPGWQAAEQAAKPTIREQTRAGLPKRVPQANLVPGSPLRDERPLRIVRNADRIAENASGYFQGWRRGQQIGGYAVGGRPGRESAGWDFTREHEQDDSSEYEYRSARY
ncbi:MAG TPA: transposase, partial [Micromonosporaceae bacterium]